MYLAPSNSNLIARKCIALAELWLLGPRRKTFPFFGPFGHRCGLLISKHSLNDYNRDIYKALHQQRGGGGGRTRQTTAEHY